MTVNGTGRIQRSETGRDLILERRFNATVEDVWASITESDRTARWFGSWTGQAGVGNTITVRLGFEDEIPESEMTIVACDPPHHLALTAVDEYGSWHLEARIRADGAGAVLVFTHHLGETDDASQAGPGWEYYLDNLVAAETGAGAPDFADYYPALAEYYRSAA
ncbi:SRPBCC family protein [Mycobacterium aquaticum]|uniref:ATPase n=1 Tax=Mycobacterium aquaticum TaxID=1927124 RepID=A0A1X0A7I7_9MYCO|nr:SRPBCC family protein [Mycobacterium aquaticum]ORA26020.1 ATPase [Mycobacterium aquaticum]